MRQKVLAVRAAFVEALAHPGRSQTKNLVDRLRRRLDYHLDCTQYLHRTAEADGVGPGAWALIHNHAPCCL